MKTVLLVVLFLVPTSYANTCKRLVDCVSEVSHLTKIKYIYPENFFKEKDRLNTDLVFDKKNADTVLSETLTLFGYARIPTQLKNVWRIIPAKDIPHHPDLPSFESSKDVAPDLPNTHDPIRMVYKAKEGTDLKRISENLTPLLSPYGRVTVLGTNSLVLIDSTIKVEELIPLIQSQDKRQKLPTQR